MAAKAAGTTMASSFGGGLVALVMSYIQSNGTIEVLACINGVLGALVSVTGKLQKHPADPFTNPAPRNMSIDELYELVCSSGTSMDGFRGYKIVIESVRHDCPDLVIKNK